MNIVKRFGAIVGFICALAVLTPAVAYGKPLSALAIMNKASSIGARSKDSVSQVTFTFHSPHGRAHKVVYNMVWKSYNGVQGVDDKAMFFMQYPPQERGRAYMSWRYTPTTNKTAEVWLYLPQQQVIHKVLSQSTGGQNNTGFIAHQPAAGDPHRYRHRLVEIAHRQDASYYVIESVPAYKPEPYGRILRWISTSNFTTARLEYFDDNNHLVKQQHINWKKISGSWLWWRVQTVNFANRTSSTMEFSKVKLNVGLTDHTFSQNTLRLGFDHVL